MWGQYHNLRTSEEFLLLWKKFLREVTETGPCSAFIQHVTHEVFKQMIKAQFQPTTAASKTAPHLTELEVNALSLHHWVCLPHSSWSFKEDMHGRKRRIGIVSK